MEERVETFKEKCFVFRVAEGEFRQDLFYRLYVFPIRLPALRERINDISLLVGYLIDRYAKKLGKKIRNIDKKTIELFPAYDWPGNIRELQNVVERAVILSEGETFFSMFKDADPVDGYVIFNIRQNRYRLVTVVHYSKTTDEKQTEGHVYIRSFLTHKEYDNRSNWDRRFGTK